jgi:hypothetical protein
MASTVNLCSARDKAWIWNLLNGKILRTLSSVRAKEAGGFTAVGISSTGQAVTAAGPLMQLWDVQRGVALGAFLADAAIPPGCPMPIFRVGDSIRLAIVFGNGHIATILLPSMAKDRAKQRGVSMFGGLGGVCNEDGA